MEKPALLRDDKEEAKNYEFSEMPKIESYVTPITPFVISGFKQKFDHIVDIMKMKLELNKKSLFIKNEEAQIPSNEYNDLFTFVNDYDASKEDQYSFIFDTKNFINYAKTEEEIKNIKESKKINQELLNNLFTKSLKDKGTLVLLMDIQFLHQITTSLKTTLGPNYTTKLFMKLYIIESLPLSVVLVLQKMSSTQTPINLDEEKLLIYEVYPNKSLSKPSSCLCKDLFKVLSYYYEIYQYQGYLSEFRKAMAIPIKIKLDPSKDTIDYTITIVDTNDESLIAKKSCNAIIINKTYATDFLYLTVDGNLELCQQTESSRLMLIRPAPFNNKTSNEIKNDVSNYIAMFKFKECLSESIPVMIIQDSEQEVYEIYKNDMFTIRDVILSENKDLFRQFIFNDHPTEIESEIKIKLASKTNIKNDSDNYVPLPTHSHYSSKNLVSCFDDSYLCMFYIKCILMSSFFMNYDSFPKEKMNVLVLGAGIGTVNYYINKVYKGNVGIDSVELTKKITEVGDEYFGFNNLKNKNNKGNKNIKWYFMDAKQFILDQSNKDEYYDLIVIDINNNDPLEGICPPPCFFDDKVLSKIQKMLKKSGMYILNIISRNYKKYYEFYNELEKYFPVIYLIKGNEDLNQIHFCWKGNFSHEEIFKIYEDNLIKVSKENMIDISPISSDHLPIVRRLFDSKDFKKKLESYIK